MLGQGRVRSLSSRYFSSRVRMMEKAALPVVPAKLKFQVRLIQLHPSGLTARLVPAAAFHLPGLLGRRVGL